MAHIRKLKLRLSKIGAQKILSEDCCCSSSWNPDGKLHLSEEQKMHLLHIHFVKDGTGRNSSTTMRE